MEIKLKNIYVNISSFGNYRRQVNSNNYMFNCHKYSELHKPVTIYL